MPPIEEYVIVQQSCIGVSVYRKVDNWLATHYAEGDEVEFKSIGLTLPIAEIYDRVVFVKDILKIV